MVTFLIAAETHLVQQLDKVTDCLFKDSEDVDWHCILAARENHEALKEHIDKLWPSRCLLTNDSQWSIGEIYVTDTLSESPQPNRSCIINTMPNLMIPTNSAKLIIEVITDNREAGRQKYRHYQQNGIPPHVEHL